MKNVLFRVGYAWGTIILNAVASKLAKPTYYLIIVKTYTGLVNCKVVGIEFYNFFESYKAEFDSIQKNVPSPQEKLYMANYFLNFLI